MSKDDAILVKVPPFDAEFTRLDPQLYFMQRILERDKASDEYELFTEQWCLSFLHVRDRYPGFWRDGKLHPITKPCFVYLPPKSLTRWRIPCGNSWLTTFFSMHSRPDFFPKEPVIFEGQNRELPCNLQGIVGIIQNRQAEVLVSIASNPSALALRTKRTIDELFRKPLRLSEVADSLQTSLTVMSRYFKKAYGMTPVAYLNNIRVREALRMLMFESMLYH